MSVKCANCGAAVTDDSKFCNYCGAKLPEENVSKVEVSGTIHKKITHQFNLMNETRIRKIEAKEATAREKLRQQTIREENERKQRAILEEIERKKAQDAHDRAIKNAFAVAFFSIFFIIALIIFNAVGRH